MLSTSDIEQNSNQMPLTTHDEWRLTARFTSARDARAIFSRLRQHAAAALAAHRLKQGVVAEHDGDWLRVHAASYEALCRAQYTIAQVAELERVRFEEDAQHRSARTQQWVGVSLAPLPDAEAQLAAEHHGSSTWGADAEPGRVEIRFEMTDRDACIDFAEALGQAGYEVHRHGSFLFLFADDSESAHQLGERLRKEAPNGAKLYYMGEGGPRTIFF